MQASLQSMLPASTIFESWLPMDSETSRKCNCNVRVKSPPALYGQLSPQDEPLNQSPVPGLVEKYSSNLPSMPSKSLASAGDSFFWVMFGQLLAYSVFTSSHFSRPGSVSGLMASAGHSGSHTPQSMHSSGWMTSMLSPS